MRILRIGDPHIKPNNIEEADKLLAFIQSVIEEQKPDRIEILGDLFHTHAVLRLEVLEFWDKWLEAISNYCPLFILVGNHDMTGDYNSGGHSLSVFKHMQKRKQFLRIIDEPTIDGIYGYMPYVHSKDNFIALANGLASAGAKVLVCHQSFSTSRFESGTYDPEGIDSAPLNFGLIVSGHIHKRQAVDANGKVILHPGTPKWDTSSDANEEKGIHIYNHDDVTGRILDTTFFNTKHVVTKIVSIVWEEGKDLPAIESGVKTTIELIGSSAWVTEQKKSLKGHYSLKTQITDRIDKSARKPGKNFYDFVQNIFVTNVDKTKLLEYMKEKQIV